MAKKKAIFICATYRRPALLQEMLACFLAQEWDGDKHMVIVNDEVDQELVFDHPEVTIINLKQRVPLTGKRNIAAAEMIRADYFFMHADDDDLFSPDRIQVCVDNMANGEIFKTDKFMLDTNPPSLVYGRNIANYAFTGRLLMRYGGYFVNHSHPWDDINLINHLDYYMEYNGLKCSPIKAPFLFYRKNIEGVANYSDGQSSGETFTHGRIELNPVLDMDWDFRYTLDKAVPIESLDSTYSKVDLTQFYKGIGE